MSNQLTRVGTGDAFVAPKKETPHKILRHLLIKEDDHIANCVIEFLREEEGGKGCVCEWIGLTEVTFSCKMSSR